MKILFIAEFYAPDSVIGAVRISKLSKYLYRFGHDVTVLCSSKFLGKKDDKLLEELEGISIHRYDNIPYIEKTNISIKRKDKKSRKLIFASKKILKIGYMNLIYPLNYFKETKRNREKIINYYKDNLASNGYDIIIATFSPAFTIEAGIEISEKENIPLIVDLRDLMDGVSYPFFIRCRNERVQERAISGASCTYVISNGQKKILSAKYKALDCKIEILNNGLDEENLHLRCHEEDDNTDQNSMLIFAYTGIIYGGRRDLTPLFRVMAEIRKSRSYDFKLIYAGTESQLMGILMDKYGIRDMLDDRGSLSRSEADAVQNEADIFLVSSWNTKKEQGMMTGKFYDGVRTGKPIISLMDGDVPDSDLYQVNEEFHYGYCYEACRNQSYEGLRDYVIYCCEEKRNKGFVRASYSNKLIERFSYKNIARQLEKKILAICDG